MASQDSKPAMIEKEINNELNKTMKEAVSVLKQLIAMLEKEENEQRESRG